MSKYKNLFKIFCISSITTWSGTAIVLAQDAYEDYKNIHTDINSWDNSYDKLKKLVNLTKLYHSKIEEISLESSEEEIKKNIAILDKYLEKIDQTYDGYFNKNSEWQKNDHAEKKYKILFKKRHYLLMDQFIKPLEIRSFNNLLYTLNDDFHDEKKELKSYFENYTINDTDKTTDAIKQFIKKSIKQPLNKIKDVKSLKEVLNLRILLKILILSPNFEKDVQSFFNFRSFIKHDTKSIDIDKTKLNFLLSDYHIGKQIIDYENHVTAKPGLENTNLSEETKVIYKLLLIFSQYLEIDLKKHNQNRNKSMKNIIQKRKINHKDILDKINNISNMIGVQNSIKTIEHAQNSMNKTISMIHHSNIDNHIINSNKTNNNLLEKLSNAKKYSNEWYNNKNDVILSNISLNNLIQSISELYDIEIEKFNEDLELLEHYLVLFNQQESINSNKIKNNLLLDSYKHRIDRYNLIIQDLQQEAKDINYFYKELTYKFKDGFSDKYMVDLKKSLDLKHAKIQKDLNNPSYSSRYNF